MVADGFVGKSLIERHRKVNEVLADELKPEGVHALAIEAHAPGASAGKARFRSGAASLRAERSNPGANASMIAEFASGLLVASLLAMTA